MSVSYQHLPNRMVKNTNTKLPTVREKFFQLQHKVSPEPSSRQTLFFIKLVFLALQVPTVHVVRAFFKHVHQPQVWRVHLCSKNTTPRLPKLNKLVLRVKSRQSNKALA